MKHLSNIKKVFPSNKVKPKIAYLYANESEIDFILSKSNFLPSI